jgi:hypothetical protein
MDKMIAFCGLTCTECLAFIATQKDDDGERKKVAKLWSKEYKSEIKPEDIRKCGQEKEVKNCAYCDDFACEKLTKFFDMAPETKTTLVEIRKNL